MADDVTLPGTGAKIATDDDGTRQYQWVKPAWGADDTYNKVDIASGKPLPVQVRSATGLIPIGEPTDAKSTATDGTSTTAISIWKQISASVQLMVFGAGTAAAAQRVTLASDGPGVAALGATTDAKVVTDANGTIQQYLRGIVTFLANALGAGTAAAANRVTLASDDPAVATLGATTGAKVVTDANGTIQQYLRGIVTFLANALGAGTAAAANRVTLASDDPAVATLGATTGAAVITDANGTIQQYLRGLIKQWVAGTLTLASMAYSVAITITRTNDTNAYAANDVIGAATGSTAAIEFTNIGPSAGRVMITSVSLEIDSSALISGETSYLLHLYNVTPPSALGDNVAHDLPSGDRASYLGSISLGLPVDLGSTLYVANDGVNKVVKLSGTSIFAYLVTVGAHTPAAQRVYITTMHALAL